METLTPHARRRAAVLGALVADAASLGLHWIYAQPPIRRAAPQEPEFRDPDPTIYEGVPAFFAHGMKKAGDSTQYGEYALVALRALVAADGRWEPGAFLSEFQRHFGPGGSYVGYADGPMRETLFNATTMARRIESAARELDLGVSDETRAMIAHYVGRYFLEYDAEGLKRVVREAVGMHEGIGEADLAACDRAVEAMQALRRAPGADDIQMPALTRVAVMVARFGNAPAAELESIVAESTRMTNDNDEAVAYAVGLARLLVALTSEEGVRRLGTPGPEAPADRAALESLIRDAFRDLPTERHAELERALGMLSQDTKAVTLKFVPACDCRMGVPSAIHNALTHDTFTEAVRVNIYACGDSCGRAMVLGPVMGALYGIGGSRGIPQSWIDRTAGAAEAVKLMTRIDAGS